MSTERLLSLPNADNHDHGSISNIRDPQSSQISRGAIPSSSNSGSNASHNLSRSALSKSSSSQSAPSSKPSYGSIEPPRTRIISKHSRFKGTGTPADSLAMMGDVLDTLYENKVPGPQLFRLGSEFGNELGSGSQFQVTAASEDHAANLQHAIMVSDANLLKPAMGKLLSCVVKRAHWFPEVTPHRHHDKERPRDRSDRELKKELLMQLRSAKVEIDKLCNKAYKKHKNIVELRGWGLCLDTYEGLKPFDTRIPLLVLERATCDLGQFLSNRNYDFVEYNSLRKICADVGNGLGGLHQGNVTHGDMKPENVLLFIDGPPPTWVAKLCDFGNAESKPDSISQYEWEGDGKACHEHFEYCGTSGWAPPENLKKLDFEALKCCDIYVYGLIVWRIFEEKNFKGFSTRTLPGPVDEENLAPYRDPQQDKSYRSAARTIQKSPFIQKRAEDPVNETRRILAVLRAALQPDPRHRDPRPWRYLNTVRFPTVRNFEEAPGLKENDAVTSLINSYVLPLFSAKIPRIQECTRSISRRIGHSATLLSERGKLWVSNWGGKTGRQGMFEKLFSQVSDRVNLGWDLDNLNLIRHTGTTCHDLTTFLQAFVGCCRNNPSPWNPDHMINAYARLRSRFPLCCWQLALRQSHLDTFNALEMFGQPPSGDGHGWLFRRRLRGYSTSSISTLAWLLRGEIGGWELRTIENTENDSNALWVWTCQSDLPIEASSKIFQLLVEKGGYVGRLLKGQDGLPKTVLRQYLEAMTEESSNTFRNQELIRNSCATVLRSIATRLTRRGDPPSAVSHAKERFFLSGEGPDQILHSDPGSVEVRDAISTTILHEAVLSCCHVAVDYFTNSSAIPPTVRDQNSETPLDLACRIRTSNLKDWQHVHNSLIIGTLSKNSSPHEPITGLPLGWDMTEFEPGFAAYHESTINPQDPSVTFQAPKFSLLQQRTINLGSPTVLGEGPVYGFDLVRFIYKETAQEEAPATNLYNETWYKADSKNAHALPGDLLYVQPLLRSRGESIATRLAQTWEWVEIKWPQNLTRASSEFLFSVVYLVQLALARILLISKVVLFNNWSSVLFVFLPCSVVAHANHWEPLTCFILSFFAVIAVIAMLEFCMHQWNLRANSNLEQSPMSYVVSCFPELCLGISTLLRSDTSCLQLFLLGNIMCSLLLIPGVCFYAAGINNRRTGWASGIEQDFNWTTNNMMTELVSLASIFAAIVFAFVSSGTASAYDPGLVLLISSRTVSCISILLYIIWLVFRFQSHAMLFDQDHYDGYDDGEREESQLAPWEALIAAMLLFPVIYVEMDYLSVSLSLQGPATQKLLAAYALPFIQASKHIKSVRFAFQDKMDESLALTLGFAVTLSLFVGPLLVISAWILGQDLSLSMDIFEAVAFFLSAWSLTIVIWNGKSNYFDGASLIGMYILLGLAFYFAFSS